MNDIEKLLQRISSGVSLMSDWVDGNMDATCTQDDETADTVHVEGCGCNGLVSWAKWQDGYDDYAEAMRELQRIIDTAIGCQVHQVCSVIHVRGGELPAGMVV